MSGARRTEVGSGEELRLQNDLVRVPAVATQPRRHAPVATEKFERLRIKVTNEPALAVAVVEDTPSSSFKPAAKLTVHEREVVEVQDVLALVEDRAVVRAGGDLVGGRDD